MRSLTLPILRSGALIDVHIGLSEARRHAHRVQGLPVPPLVQAKLLIDTGASVSMVDEALMRTLQLSPTSATEFHSPSTSGVAQTCNVYDVQMVLGGIATPNTLRIDPLAMMANSFINHAFDGLLGRDVLARLVIAWNGPGQTVRMDYA